MSGGQTLARDVRACAAEWLERRVSDDWSEQDQEQLDLWLAQSPTHRIAYLRVHAAWDKADRLAALHVPASHNMTAEPRSGFLTIFMRLAAVWAILGVAGVAAAIYISTPKQHAYATGVGGHEIITLGDGTKIELNTDTAITATIGLDRRTIQIAKGEVYFEVTHDASRPFVVLAAGHRIVDLGTKFLVRTQATGLRVSLVDGKARLESAGAGVQEHSAVLTPGDVVVATANSMSVARAPLSELSDALVWRRGMLVFSHITLGEAAAEFNRYNTHKLVVAADIAALKINGTFAKSSVGSFARTAQYALGLRVVEKGDEIVISR